MGTLVSLRQKAEWGFFYRKYMIYSIDKFRMQIFGLQGGEVQQKAMRAKRTCKGQSPADGLEKMESRRKDE